jgi:hypothetical protein
MKEKKKKKEQIRGLRVCEGQEDFRVWAQAKLEWTRLTRSNASTIIGSARATALVQRPHRG